MRNFLLRSIPFSFAPENMKKTASNDGHIRPIFFSNTVPAAQTAQKQKPCTIKSRPLMQDWVFKMGLQSIWCNHSIITLTVTLTLQMTNKTPPWDKYLCCSYAALLKTKGIHNIECRSLELGKKFSFLIAAFLQLLSFVKFTRN